MNKATFIILILILTGCQVQKNINSTVDATTGLDAIPKGQVAERDLAIAQAKNIYQQKLAIGEDFSAGPCLSERVIDDWVVDLAHNPRTEVDNQPENQCQNYRNGIAHHFVELDLEGNLIQAE